VSDRAAAVGPPTIDQNPVPGSYDSTNPRPHTSPKARSRAAGIAITERLRDEPLLRLRQRRGEEVVVAFAVPERIRVPGDLRPRDRKLKDVPIPCGLPAAHLPPRAAVQVPHHYAAGVVGDSASVDCQRHHQSMRPYDLHAARGSSRRAHHQRNTRDPGSQNNNSLRKLLHPSHPHQPIRTPSQARHTNVRLTTTLAGAPSLAIGTVTEVRCLDLLSGRGLSSSGTGLSAPARMSRLVADAIMVHVPWRHGGQV
jgi:hypothetical protein